MDSRIRELEQWLAEAKRDLGECGQEAYLQKLYLLDAEIRAVIKANGAQPGALSPEQQGRLVRGQARQSQSTTVSRRTALTLGVAGVALLAATTVAFGLPALRGSSSQLARFFDLNRNNYTANSGQLGTDAMLSDAGQSSTTPPAGFIPASLPGEEILPANWTPAADELAGVTLLADAHPATQTGSILAGTETVSHSAPARMGELRSDHSSLNQSGIFRNTSSGRVDLGVIMASQPTVQPAAGSLDTSSRPQRVGAFDANQAIDVMVANSGSREAADSRAISAGPVKPKSGGMQGQMAGLHGDVNASSGGGLGERSIGRYVFGRDSFEFPADYKPGHELDTKQLAKRNNGKKNKSSKSKQAGAGGGKSSAPASESRAGEAEEITLTLTSSGSGSPQGNEHGGDGAES